MLLGEIMTACPWYVNGVCYSPKTIQKYSKPSASPVSRLFCLSENKYQNCPFYVKKDGEKETELFEAMGIATKKGFYPSIHVISCALRSDCPFYKLVDVEEELCVAYCKVAEKYLTRSSTKKCIAYWKDCPFYKIGIELASSS